MIFLRYLIFVLITLPFVANGQISSVNRPDTIISKYANLKFIILDIDTMITHCVSGEYNSPNFKRWDSATIHAYITMEELPKNVDFKSLKTKINLILKDHKFDIIYVFRDRQSYGLFHLSSAYAYKLLNDKDGYLGQFKNE